MLSLFVFLILQYGIGMSTKKITKNLSGENFPDYGLAQGLLWHFPTYGGFFRFPTYGGMIPQKAAVV